MIVASVSQLGRFALVVAFGLTFVAHAKAAEATYAQRLACTSDAFRLCASEMPDADAVRTCMLANKSQLSAGCLATFRKATASR